MRFLIGIVWIVVGAIIATPYTFLANGSSTAFVFTIVAGPPLLILLLLMWNDGRKERIWRGRKYTWLSNGTFWALVWFLCLPILLNGLSIIVRAFGYATAASYIFAARYVSLIFIPNLVAIGFLSYCLVKSVSQRRRRSRTGGTPPVAGPPMKNAITRKSTVHNNGSPPTTFPMTAK